MAQVGLFDMVDVDAVIADLAVGKVIESVDEVRDRGLACARRADEGQLLAGLGVERDVVQDRLFGVIGKVHVKEAHVAAELYQFSAAVLLRAFPCPDAGAHSAFCQRTVRRFRRTDQRDMAVVLLRLLVDQLKDAACACGSHNDGVDLLGNLRDIAGKLLCHAKERCDDRDFQRRKHTARLKQVLEGQVRDVPA